MKKLDNIEAVFTQYQCNRQTDRQADKTVAAHNAICNTVVRVYFFVNDFTISTWGSNRSLTKINGVTFGHLYRFLAVHNNIEKK